MGALITNEICSYNSNDNQKNFSQKEYIGIRPIKNNKPTENTDKPIKVELAIYDSDDDGFYY